MIAQASTQPSGSGAAASQTLVESDDVTLAVLAVPSWMTPSDFITFVAPAADGITHLRMIRYPSFVDRSEFKHLMRGYRRDFAPNRSIVVMKFREPSNTVEFIEEYNGKQFNSMEVCSLAFDCGEFWLTLLVVQHETCHVVRVLSVAIEAEDHVSQGISRLSSLRISGSYELPTCPVCLERMDAAVTGLVTVPCSHTFHCACLSKWGDSRCARYLSHHFCHS